MHRKVRLQVLRYHPLKRLRLERPQHYGVHEQRLIAGVVLEYQRPDLGRYYHYHKLLA